MKPTRTLARRVAWALTFAALAHPAACWAARFDWRADLMSHFAEPALLASIAGAAAMTRVRRSIAVALALLALVQAGDLSRCSWPNPVPPDPRSPDRLRVLVVNVLTDNAYRDPLIQLIRRERPDVVGLIEVDSAWLRDLGPARADYPYRLEFPSDVDARGLALWSRRPPSGIGGPEPLAPGGNPALRATVNLGGREVRLWLVHNVSPFERPAALPLGAEFAALAERVRRDGGPTLVVGDVNSTDGSPHFGRFLRDSGLRDGRVGFGRQPSWPSWSPYRIAIDHAFVSAELAVAGRRLGPAIGSDHFPVVVDVALAAPAVASPATNRAAQDAASSSGGDSSPANLARSARRRNATRPSARSGPSRSARPGSAAISSVVFDPQAGPKAAIKAPRTASDAAIRRRRGEASASGVPEAGPGPAVAGRRLRSRSRHRTTTRVATRPSDAGPTHPGQAARSSHGSGPRLGRGGTISSALDAPGS